MNFLASPQTARKILPQHISQEQIFLKRVEQRSESRLRHKARALSRRLWYGPDAHRETHSRR